MPPTKVFIGVRVGKRVVLEIDGPKVKARCDCGRENWITRKSTLFQTDSCQQCSARTLCISRKKGFSPKIGDRFGKWTVIQRNICRRSKHLCRCDCGQEVWVLQQSLVGGFSYQCQDCANDRTERLKVCPDVELLDRLTSVIQGAFTRCYNDKEKGWDNYGGRGIKVCNEWLNDRLAFLAHLMTLPGHDDPTLTIDRINNDGDYSPGNLRFATRLQQRHNQRRCEK